MIRRLLIFMILAIAGVAAAAAFLVYQPYKGFENPVLLDLPRGMPTRSFADRLVKAGVIRDARLFLIARALHPGAVLQAGEYEFHDAESPEAVFERIARGDVHYYELTIREGSDIFDIADAVGKLGLVSGSEFLKAARNPAPVKDLAPKAPSLEGFLFPSTYRVTRSVTVAQLIKMMTDQFRARWKAALGDAHVNVLETVTLASLIEKESGVPRERPIVASVYMNRLKKDVKLECDPTTIYAAKIEGRWKGVIHKSDLASENPYNTYQRVGLPPGPIASAGQASLEAALHPADTAFLFFVAKGDGSGSHNFSVDYKSHQNFVAAYRRNRGK